MPLSSLHRTSFAVLASALAVAASPAAADDLEWLEKSDDPRALEWARAKTAETKAALAALPSYPDVLAALRTALKANTPIADVQLMGDRAVRLFRDAGHPKGLLQVADRGGDGTPGDWRTVLDVAAYGKAQGKPYSLNWGYASSCLPPAYERCLLAFSDGGSDEVALREFDLKTAAFVAGGFSSPAARVQSAWLTKDSVLIAHTIGDSPKTAAGWGAAARLWKRGTDAATAPVIFTAPPTDATLQFARQGSAARAIITRVINYSTFELHSVDAAGVVTKLDLPAKLKPFGPLGGTDRHALFQLAEPATVNGRPYPGEAILAYDFGPKVADADRVQLVYAPAEGEVIGFFAGYASSRDRIFLPVQKSLKTTIKAARFGAKGWDVSPLVVGEAGIDLSVASASAAGEDIVIRRTGFLNPTSLELRSATGATQVLAQEKHGFDASAFVVDVKSVPSTDGTSIDYYLVRPKSPVRPGAVPTLITGYGAFGITLSPSYLGRSFGGQALKLWFDRGGALVLPAIRGGGERGQAWHQAAIREKRQISYDDFIAVTQDLVASGFTSAKNIGVFGSSNGGLLSAVVATQRPDLYGAAISDVPLADMLRYPKIAMGAAWMDEYGDPSKPEIAAKLRAYSPVQNIDPGATYPPFLVTVSTTDNRVGPGHARKLAARLMETPGEAWLLEDEEGGHGVSDPLARPDIMAMRMTFLINHLMND